jgi:hypothetical protein
MKLHTFLQNVAECTKLGGYFIGTCFDGARIFQALSRLESGDDICVLSGGSGDPQKIWSARKKYHQTEFEPDSSSIGYEIEVYQDTINKATREYLVHFDYLTQLLENYGFDLVSPEEAAMTLMFPMPDGTATFDGMFHQMELDCKKKRDEMGGGSGDTGGGSGDTWTRQCRQEYGSALYMTPEEKQISFYNRYFIFRKNRNINAKQLKSSFLSYAGLQEEQDRASAAGGDDDALASIALEKIAKASKPIDVASKPAIAAHILREQKTEKQMVALQGSETGAGAGAKQATMKIKPKPKKTTTTTVKAAAATAAAAAEPETEEAPSAPIAQIEKKIQKRTKKMKPKDSDDMSSSSGAGAAAAASDAPPPSAPKPKRQTKKKTDL